MVLNPEWSTSILDAPKKTTVIALRWLVVITCAYLLLSAPETLLAENLVHGFVLLYIVTGLALYFVPERVFDSSYFYSPLVIFDTLAITFSLVVARQLETDFYLTYFVVIIICATWKDPRWSVSITALISLLYGYLLFYTVEAVTASMFLRVPFLFAMSVFYSYFVQLVVAERHLRRKAEQEALRDPLTGLFSRREFERRLEIEFARAKRYRRRLSLLMLDIDNFKQVNDTHGHPWGDRVLARIAEDLQRQTRLSDLVCRFGGEEFVIILPETDLEDAALVANRVREAIKQRPFRTDSGPFYVTASIGVSSTTARDYASATELLTGADKMLYVAKSRGKDRVETGSSPAAIPIENSLAS
ncbi:MAG TPA: GGDEF domain-containing protein [Candidatus Acidoferrales bacterium]|nr:GGDEF domain-containing protein [Candidatus Acidoferrales bacterium]